MSRPLQRGLAREHRCDSRSISWWAGVHRPTTMGSSKTIEVKCVRNFKGDVV